MSVCLATAIVVGACGDAVRNGAPDVAGETVTYPANKCSSAGWLEFASEREYPAPDAHPLADVIDLAVDSRGAVLAIEGQGPFAYLFNAEAEFERVIAGPGSGPGELNLPRAVQFVGDSTLMIASRAPARLQEYTRAGELMSGTQLDLGGFGSDVINVVPDWEIAPDGTIWVGLRKYDQSSLAGDSVSYTIAKVGRDGRASTPVVELQLPGRSRGGPAILWQPRWRWTAADTLLIASPGDHARLLQFNYRGRVLRIIESGDPVVHVDERTRISLLEGYLQMLAGQGQPEETLRQTRAIVEVASPFPRITEILIADDASQFWVRSLSSEWNGLWPVQWIYEIYDMSGGLMACAEMPGGFRPRAVRDGRVWGTTRDALDVPHILRYDLQLPVHTGELDRE